jgi:hypothetical protein
VKGRGEMRCHAMSVDRVKLEETFVNEEVYFKLKSKSFQTGDRRQDTKYSEHIGSRKSHALYVSYTSYSLM